MRAAWLLLACAACSSAPPPPDTTVDAGPDVRDARPDAPPVTLTQLGDVFVARGRTASAGVAAPQGVPLTISLIDLPPGVTATPAMTDAYGAASVELTVASDAPTSDVSAQAVAYDSTGLRGTCALRVAVTGSDGAPDSTFGVGGVELPPSSGHFASIARAGAHLLVGQSTSLGDCQLARLNLDGTSDTSFGTGGVVEVASTVCGGVAADSSGGAGVLLYGTQSTALVTVDANGVVGNPVAVPSAVALGWTGTSWLAFGNGNNAAAVATVSTSGQTMVVTLPFYAMEGGAVAADGTALAFGHAGYNATQAKAYKLVQSQAGDWVVDTSYGTAGAADLGATGLDATAAISDGQGGFFVGVDSSVVHVVADGTSTDVLQLALSPIRAFAALPSGDFIAIGDHENETGLARFDSHAHLVATFGAFGFTETTALPTTYAVTAVHDGTSHLYVSDSLALVRFTVAP